MAAVMDALKKFGYYDDTSVFAFSDHGDYTGDYDIVEKVQNCFENDLTNIPLVIKPAKQFACKPRITKALAELVDLNATVSEMTGVPLDYVQYGKSLVHGLSLLRLIIRMHKEACLILFDSVTIIEFQRYTVRQIYK